MGDIPVAPLGLWVVGFLFSIHLSPLWGYVGSLVHWVVRSKIKNWGHVRYGKMGYFEPPTFVV